MLSCECSYRGKSSLMVRSDRKVKFLIFTLTYIFLGFLEASLLQLIVRTKHTRTLMYAIRICLRILVYGVADSTWFSKFASPLLCVATPVVKQWLAHSSC